MHTLIVYSTTDGHTRKICEYLGDKLKANGEQVSLVDVQTGEYPTFSADKIVVAASIRYGHHHQKVEEFVELHRKALEEKPAAFFSVNLVARKPGRNELETNPYVAKFLAKTRWSPDIIKIFAGKLNYPVYSFLDKWIIRLIMWLTKGPADGKSVVEFTDWREVDALAEEIQLLRV